MISINLKIVPILIWKNNIFIDGITGKLPELYPNTDENPADLIERYFSGLDIQITVKGVLEVINSNEELSIYYRVIPDEALPEKKTNLISLEIAGTHNLMPRSTISIMKSEEAKLIGLVDLLKRIDKKCPWTKERSFVEIVESVKSETVELEEAFSDDSLEETASEMGDVIYTSLLAAWVFARDYGVETGEIISGVCDKIARRKPWLFASEKVSVGEAVNIWAQQKELENNKNK